MRLGGYTVMPRKRAGGLKIREFFLRTLTLTCGAEPVVHTSYRLTAKFFNFGYGEGFVNVLLLSYEKISFFISSNLCKTDLLTWLFCDS
jgi:hypothetical protein